MRTVCGSAFQTDGAEKRKARLEKSPGEPAPNRQRNCCRKSSTLGYHTDLKLIYMLSYHAVYDETTI